MDALLKGGGRRVGAGEINRKVLSSAFPGLNLSYLLFTFVAKISRKKAFYSKKKPTIINQLVKVKGSRQSHGPLEI